jgi:hypothetical protein
MSMNTVPQDEEQLRATVREHYTQSILSVLNPEQSSTGCCGTSTSSAGSCYGTSCCGGSDDKSMAKEFLILVVEAVLMCCSRPGEWALQALPMDLI